MTVTLIKPAEPAPVALAREALAELEHFRGDATRSQMAQVITGLERSVRELLALVSAVETVTEYGVQSWSRAFGHHHVEECRDLHEARSVLAWTRRRVDASAFLVARQVPSPSTAGAWRAVSPDDAVAALEASKAVAS